MSSTSLSDAPRRAGPYSPEASRDVTRTGRAPLDTALGDCEAQSRGSRTQGGLEIASSRRLARFNKRVTNRVQGVYAWLVPPWAVILHRGRRSGRQYRTPLFAFRRDRTLIIALLYGRRSDWLRNLRHGGGHVIRAGRTLTLAPPEIVDTSEARPLLARLSRPERAYCRLAEALAIIELGEQLPGFGPRRRGV